MTKSRHRRQACPLCGQVFTAHYEIVAEGSPVRTSVPCLSDGCEGIVVISHPRTAFALWLEEL